MNSARRESEADVHNLRQLHAQVEQQRRELDALRNELETARAHLATAARRAANAGLAHGLTHEFNNALTPIIGNAQILTMLHAHDPEIVERAAQIIAHARRIAGWTTALRQLSAEGSRGALEFSFNGVAREVFDLYAERFERLGIVPHMELDASLPALLGNPNRLGQVLMLLVQNATEAMPDGGEIVLRTVYDAAHQQVEATLSDTGIGIAPEHKPHLFEPGFTTKDEATRAPAGWGLYTTRQIIEAHAGSIQITSSTGAAEHGTMVWLCLPLKLGPAT